MPDPEKIEQAVMTRIHRIDAAIFGTTVGLLAGTALFALTNCLVLIGGRLGPDGPVDAPHLALLSHFFSGYTVTFLGSIVGFLYAFVVLGTAAYGGALIYQKIADFRHGPA